tara:strand:+ start:230 stop:637 length:408 start_codon:yes stop_codon:yes gene_type:complete
MKQKNRFTNWKYPEIIDGELTKYNWVVQNKSNFRLGHGVDIGAFTYINAQFGVNIKDNVQIGSHCSIYSVSTIDNKHGEVILEKNSCIGSHSTILPNVTIGENSIIGAHSFVTKSIPKNVMAMGVPAMIYKKLDE